MDVSAATKEYNLPWIKVNEKFKEIIYEKYQSNEDIQELLDLHWKEIDFNDEHFNRLTMKDLKSIIEKKESILVLKPPKYKKIISLGAKNKKFNSLKEFQELNLLRFIDITKENNK